MSLADSFLLADSGVFRSEYENAYNVVVHTDVDGVGLSAWEPVSCRAFLLSREVQNQAFTRAHITAMHTLMDAVVDRPWIALGQMLGARQ